MKKGKKSGIIKPALHSKYYIKKFERKINIETEWNILALLLDMV
jgi:hypothetical protein